MATLILLDRDGVINYDSPDYIKSVAEFLPIPGSLEAIVRLKQRGFKVAVCTNQAGIGRGIFETAALTAIHEALAAALAARGVALDGLIYCPHTPEEGCDCRKPRPGMLDTMMTRLGVPPHQTVYVGDALKDMEAARNAGCRGLLVRTGHGAAVEDQARSLGAAWVADDLAEAARILMAEGPC